MNSCSHFQRGTGAFKCGVCGRLTRHTGVQSTGADLCPQCYELAGLDNLLNDCAEERVAGNYREAQRLLAEITSKGGNPERVRSQNEYAFPAVAPSPVAAGALRAATEWSEEFPPDDITGQLEMP